MKIDELDAVVLCGGLGKRLRSVVGENPKVMAEFDGQPFLDLLIEYLKSQGLQRVILCTGYKAEAVESYYREHDHNIVIDFAREEKPLGTAGALKNAREIIDSDPFFVLNGDSLCLVDLKAMLDYHFSSSASATVVVSTADQKKDFGGVVLDRKNKVQSFLEKSDNPQSNLFNAGIYCFNQSFFCAMPEGEVLSLEHEVFPQLIKKSFFGFKVQQEFFDIGTPERLKRAQKQFNNKNLS